MQLTEKQQADAAILPILRAQGILEDIRIDQFPVEAGDVLITCADGDQDRDLRSHHWGLCAGGRPCHHGLSLNGGPLLIPEYSPISKYGEDIVLLQHAYGAHRLKGVPTVHLYGHWPCGMAALADLSIVDCLQLLSQAKERVLTFFSEQKAAVKVVPLFHVQWVTKDNERRSYKFNRERFAQWRQPTLGELDRRLSA